MAAPLPEADGDLVLLALEGRQDAFSALYERYFPSVFDFLTRLLRNREEAADVAQDTFIKGLEQLPTLKNPDRFKSWIFTIAHRTGLNRIRASKRAATVPGAVDDDERATMAVADADPTVNPEQMAAIQEAADIVWEAAAGLDPRTYAVMDLHVRQGLDSAEIAEVMGVTKGNAYTMVSRMKQSFSKTLATYLLVRKGRQDCDDLAGIIAPDIEKMTPELRRRADRHVSKCSVCSENKVLYFEPVKMFAALMLVPVPAGLKAAIWGSVGAGAAGAATAGAAVGAASGAAGSSSGGVGAAASGAGAAGAQTGVVVGIAAAAVVAAAVAVGGFLVFSGPDKPEPVAAPPTAVVVAPAPAVAEPVAPTATTPPPAMTTTTTTSTTTPPTTTAPVVAAPPPTTVPPPPPTTVPPPPPLVVVGDTATVDEDQVLTVDVLANDTGPVDPGSLSLASAPANGAATAGSGIITYTPDANFVGLDEFSYSVADTLGRAASGTVTVAVNAINDDPTVPGPGAITVDEDGVISFDPLAGAFDVDGDVLTMTSFDPFSAAGGTLTAGSLVYTPPPDFFGTDSFSYVVSDGSVDITITVSVEIVGVPDAPLPPAGGPIAGTAPEDGSGVLNLLEGWVDPDGNVLSVVPGTVTSANGGTVVIAADGTAVYTSPANFSGSDSFEYIVTDGTLQTVATATVEVTATNDPPVVEDVTFTIEESTPAGTLIGVIPWSDPDGDTVTFEPVGTTIAITTDGSVKVVKDLDFQTAPVFVLTTTASDGNGGEAEVTVTVLVLDTNDAPELADTTLVIPEGTMVGTAFGQIIGSDPDPADTLTYAIVDGDPEGVLAIESDSGVIGIQRAPNLEPFPTVVTVSASDNSGSTATAVVTLIVEDATGPAVTSFTSDRSQIFAGIEPDLACPLGQGTAVLQLTATDASGLRSVVFSYSGNIAGSVYSGTIVGDLVGDTATANFSIFLPEARGWKSSEFVINAAVVDLYGNTTTSADLEVTVRGCPNAG